MADRTRKKADGLARKRLALAELVKEQEGAITSRQILKKKTGTVTVFAFAEGEGLSEHTAPFDALVYVFAGEAEIRVSGRPFRIRKGEMIIMPAGEPHALRAVKAFKMMLVMIRS
ncbi:MAG: cupin domain-containing protein [Elusimicrobiota bacterium]